MNFYTRDISLFDYASFCDDPIIIPFSLHTSSWSSNYPVTPRDYDNNNHEVVVAKPKSPPTHPHDGTSPLPLGMDWSLPPRRWDGRNSVWPHDPHRGWSYCITIPSWVLLPRSRSAGPVAFYRVQVGVQSPEGITTTRVILRRFSDFLQLLSELKRSFPKKTLPPAPPRTILRMKRETLLEERRCSLEDWMERLLSDIDVSRSAPVGTFLELEAAARLYFDDVNQESSVANSSLSGITPSVLIQTSSDVSIHADASDPSDDYTNEISDLGTTRHGVGVGMEVSTSYGTCIPQGTIDGKKLAGNMSEECLIKDEIGSLPQIEHQRLRGHTFKLSTGSIGSDSSSIRASEKSNLGMDSFLGDDSTDLLEGAKTPNRTTSPVSSDLQLATDMQLALPSEKRHKVNRVLYTLQQRLGIAKADIEDLIARLNQEVAVRQFLTTKVRDLELDLESTKNNCKENMQHAALIERERFTHIQWDIEELRRQCLQMELKLKSEQEEKEQIESSKISTIRENELLLQQLNVVRIELENLRKDHEELERKWKAEEKVLVKEVKSLRSAQSELKRELSQLMREKLEVETVLQKENQRAELITTANSKFIHECEILRSRLQECSINFLIEEDKLIVDASFLSDATDLLATSDNRIGLLLAEAQLLAQDVENSFVRSDGTHKMTDNNGTHDELRKMLTEVLIDNARLRMQTNSVIRCTVNSRVEYDHKDEGEETPLSRTVFSKFRAR